MDNGSWIEQEFGRGVGSQLRGGLPAALSRAQAQSSNAHDAFDSASEELFVYGTAMWRAAHDRVAECLNEVNGFHTKTPKDAKRALLLIDGRVILPLRVGTSMPRRIDRYRLKRPSPYRQTMLSATSMLKYDREYLSMFNEPQITEDDEAVAEADFLASAAAEDSLTVLYFSSTVRSLGSIYWSPAILDGSQTLRFVAPTRLIVERDTATATVRPRPVADPDAFASGERPVTPTKLRDKPRPSEA